MWAKVIYELKCFQLTREVTLCELYAISRFCFPPKFLEYPLFIL